MDAALSRFSKQGWAGTKVAEIARGAGVSVETIYAIFGNKRTILEALVTRAVRGDSPDMTLMEQGGPAAVSSATSPQQMIGLFARDISAVLERVGPLIGVVRAAAEADADIAPLYTQLHAGRRRNLGEVARWLASATRLRGGLDVDEAAEQIWRLASPELYLLVTRIGGSSNEDYAKWLERTLALLLLPQSSATEP